MIIVTTAVIGVRLANAFGNEFNPLSKSLIFWTVNLETFQHGV
jgi:hypothetical protein